MKTEKKDIWKVVVEILKFVFTLGISHIKKHKLAEEEEIETEF